MITRIERSASPFPTVLVDLEKTQRYFLKLDPICKRPPSNIGISAGQLIQPSVPNLPFRFRPDLAKRRTSGIRLRGP